MVAGLALAVATRPRGHGTNADEELLNLVEDRILVSKVWKIVTARKFDDLRARVLELLTPLQHEGYRIVTKDLLSHNGSAGFDNYADVICTAYPLSIRRHNDGADVQSAMKYIVPHCNSQQLTCNGAC
jgi:hypothetical protein